MFYVTKDRARAIPSLGKGSLFLFSLNQCVPYSLSTASLKGPLDFLSLAKLDSEETKELRIEYLKTRNTILEYYKDKDFLEATLQLFSK